MYVLAAWGAPPGFYDGFGPPAPYNWTCPPPQAGPTQKPASGHLDIKVIKGESDANAAFTNDGQIVIGFLPKAFDATGKSTISVDIVPTTTCPHPPGLTFVTNVYEITADAPLVLDSNVTMVYSNLEPDPTAIYLASSPDGPWTSIGASTQAQPFTIWTKTTKLGYFAAGYPKPTSGGAGGGGTTIGGGQTLPIVVAALIVIVLLAGLPLAIVRRRQGAGAESDEDE